MGERLVFPPGSIVKNDVTPARIGLFKAVVR